MTWWGCNGVIPGPKRRKPLEGKGIHQNWIPFPVLWTAGDDGRWNDSASNLHEG
jgi:hypothetical protein